MERVLRACLLFGLCGCDLVLGLDRSGHDDDGDGAPDELDLCPHLADESSIDLDGDGIGADCDVDDTVVTPGRLFWTFLDGERPAALQLVEGTATPDPEAEALVLGRRTDGQNALVVDVTTATALIDVGFEILDNAIDDDLRATPYVELGLYVAHRSFTSDLKTRGDNCYVGRNEPPDAGYLELNEDDRSHGTPQRFDGPLSGVAGRMRTVRTPARLDCVVRTTDLETSGGFDVSSPDRTGKIAISAERLRARLRYVWITYQ